MITVRDNDVLFGKGCGTRIHPGNIKYRSLVETKKPIFMQAPKLEKRQIARMIVEEIYNMDPPGRFLMERVCSSDADAAAGGNNCAKNKDGTRDWICVDREKAVTKVMHRLREKDKNKKNSASDDGNGGRSSIDLNLRENNANVVGQVNSQDQSDFVSPDYFGMMKIGEQEFKQIQKAENSGIQRPVYPYVPAQNESPPVDPLKPPSDGEASSSLIAFLSCHLGDDDFDDFSCDDFSIDCHSHEDPLENIFNHDASSAENVSSNDGGGCSPFSPDDSPSSGSSKIASLVECSLKQSANELDNGRRGKRESDGCDLQEVGATHLCSKQEVPTQLFNLHQQTAGREGSLHRPRGVGSSNLFDEINDVELGVAQLQRDQLPRVGNLEFGKNLNESCDNTHPGLRPISFGNTSSNTFVSAGTATMTASYSNFSHDMNQPSSQHHYEDKHTQSLQPSQLQQMQHQSKLSQNLIPPEPSNPMTGLNQIDFNLKDWINAAAEWISTSSTKAFLAPIERNEDYLKVYLPNALQVAHQLVEYYVSLLTRMSFSQGIDSHLMTINTASITLSITLISPNSLGGSEAFFKGGHLINSVDVLSNENTSCSIEDANGNEKYILRRLCSVFYELFALGKKCPAFDSISACNSVTNDHSNVGNEGKMTNELRRKLVLDQDSATENQSSHRNLRKKGIDRHSFQELASYGVPLALQRLLRDMAFSPLESVGTSNEARTSLEDALEDVNDMIADPNVFLYNKDYSPVRAHNKAALQHEHNSRPILCFTGRNKELSTLIEAASRIFPDLQKDNPIHASHTARNHCEIAWISGHSGEGKSCLVQNFRDHLTKNSKQEVGERFEVLHCKFDFMNQSNPFHELTLAFDQYFRDILNQSEHDNGFGSLMNQKSLLDYLTNIVMVTESNVGKMGMNTICDMIPTFRKIYSVYGMKWGSDNGTRLHDGSLINGKTRLHFIFRQFLHAMSISAKSPFLIILDDCQFADKSSFELLRNVILEFAGDRNSTHGLYVIGCFRPDEVNESHPFASFRKDIDVECNARISTINIGCLVMSEVETMISRALSLPKRKVRPLSQILHTKTSGNPLFLHQYFDLLLGENLLYFSLVQKCWMWDLSKITQKPIDDNVARHFARKLHHLPKHIKTALKICSCFGNEINFDALKLLSNNETGDMVLALNEAVKEGFVLKTESGYKFSHDAILQAAYSLIPKQHRSKFHKVLATRIISRSSHEGEIDTSSIFFAVDQINRIDKNIIVNSEERNLYSQINLKAAQKAMEVLNFKSSIEYSRSGLALLETGHWQRSYALSLKLYDIASYASYVEGKHEDVQMYLKEVFTSASCYYDKLEAYSTLISSLSASGKLKEAFQCNLNVLAKMGECFPELDEAVVKCTTVQTMLALSNKDKDSLNSLDEMTDKSKLFVMRLLKHAIHLAHMMQTKMGIIFSSRVVKLTLSHGLAKESAFGMVCFGTFLMQVNVEEGYRIGKIAMSMLDNPISTCVRGPAATIFYGKMASLVEPLQASFEPLKRAFHDNMLVGDVNFAASSAMAYCGLRLMSGDNLNLLSEDIIRYVGELLQLKQLNMVRILMTFHHFITQITGRQKDPLEKILGGDVTSKNLLEFAVSNDDKLLLSHILNKQLRLADWFDDSEQVENILNQMEKRQAQKEVIAINDPVASFVHGLAYFRLAKKTGQRIWYNKGNECIEVLKRWTSVSKWNWESKLKFVEAEHYCVSTNYEKAAECYKLSIELSRECRFIHQEGLGFERWANMCAKVGDIEAAKANLLEALRCFKSWGAIAKARQIEQRLQNFE